MTLRTKYSMPITPARRPSVPDKDPPAFELPPSPPIFTPPSVHSHRKGQPIARSLSLHGNPWEGAGSLGQLQSHAKSIPIGIAISQRNLSFGQSPTIFSLLSASSLPSSFEASSWTTANTTPASTEPDTMETAETEIELDRRDDELLFALSIDGHSDPDYLLDD